MGLEDGKYWVVTVPVRQRMFQSSPPSVCVTPAPAHGAGRRQGWCPPRQVEQGVDLAVGQVALVEPHGPYDQKPAGVTRGPAVQASTSLEQAQRTPFVL